MTICKGNDISHNLFDYATSELSQDAFFCWLLSYSTKESKEEYGDVFRVSQRFLKSMLNKDDKEDSLDYYVMNIERQKKVTIAIHDVDDSKLKNKKGLIDIFVEVKKNENKLYLIIEDKVDSWEHNQLKEYYEAVIAEDSEIYNGDNLFIAFVKTEYMNRTERNKMSEIKKQKIFHQNISVIDFEELIKILSKGIRIQEMHTYLFDFVKKLDCKIEHTLIDIENKLKLDNIGIYNGAAYRFFDYLFESKRIEKDRFDWCGYVSNKKGGFDCLTWNKIEYKWITQSERKLYLSMYLQMEIPRYANIDEEREYLLAVKMSLFYDENVKLKKPELEIQKNNLLAIREKINKEIKDEQNKDVKWIKFDYSDKNFHLGSSMRIGCFRFAINNLEDAITFGEKCLSISRRCYEECRKVKEI